MSAVRTAAAPSGRPRYASGSTALVVAASTAVAAPAVLVATPALAAVARAGAAVVVEIAGHILGIARAAVVHVVRLMLDLVLDLVLVDDGRDRRLRDRVLRLGLRPGSRPRLRGLSGSRGVGRALVLRRWLGGGWPGHEQHQDERGCEQQKALHDSPFGQSAAVVSCREPPRAENLRCAGLRRERRRRRSCGGCERTSPPARERR